MEKHLEYILAKEIGISLNKEYKYQTYDESMSENDKESGIQVLKKVMDLGLSPLASIPEFNNYNPPILLMSLLNIDSSGLYVKELFNYLKDDDLLKISQPDKENILNHLYYFSDKKLAHELVESFFQKGFKVEINHKEYCLEVNMLKAGNINFFENILMYQPDFNFNALYDCSGFLNGKKTLMEMVENENFADYDTPKEVTQCAILIKNAITNQYLKKNTKSNNNGIKNKL